MSRAAAPAGRVVGNVTHQTLRRLCWLVEQLQARRSVTRRDLAERFGVSVRQAADDVALLRRLLEEAGERAMLVWDAQEGTYRLARPLRRRVLF